ncbi:MAG: adenosylmethionine decarboxylase [Candidatus Scalindua sp. AMX11]|nr:MAG: adenosylmethionine decarboxylase [Candidatus Scalindua sp.]NOG82674.1 adenosylmethionine decarboxylase [Planctomycetota bacterium]RZV95248.1 MAG: adenosylmethionine decarboxylase [Candidatus Scalindua sp. SCAELEC01]TDE66272.1 MAG: adenosylmethionine decarboxylase [Candidatus Scalindua sp. AMX11]GJQ57895.1 MAG: S-adenosylmethionine decarboxylase proenzyme [Candidatus Scalindua sp.]
MEAYGRHLILEMWDCNRDVLNDAKKITELVSNAADVAGATVIKQFYHEFTPSGITGVAILAESHIAIHTWPVEGYVAADVFTCGTTCDPQLAVEALLKGFSPTDSTTLEIKRGSPMIKGTLLSDACSPV